MKLSSTAFAFLAVAGSNLLQQGAEAHLTANKSVRRQAKKKKNKKDVSKIFEDAIRYLIVTRQQLRFLLTTMLFVSYYFVHLKIINIFLILI
jgi:hypothetical protein